MTTSKLPSRVRALVVLAAVLCAAPVVAQDGEPSEPPTPLTDRELLHKYVWSTLGPAGALHASLWAGFEQWRASPPTWPREGRGYAERVASEYAASAIGSTTKYAVARLFHQDPSFVPCACRGAMPRLRHAIAAPFMARQADGDWVFSAATIVGLTAQNVVPAATWYPAPRGARDGAAHAATGVVSKIAVDVVREFMPARFRRKAH